MVVLWVVLLGIDREERRGWLAWKIKGGGDGARDLGEERGEKVREGGVKAGG